MSEVRDSGWAIAVFTSERGGLGDPYPISWWGVADKEYVWADESKAIEYMNNLDGGHFHDQEVNIDDVQVLPVALTHDRNELQVDKCVFHHDDVIWTTAIDISEHDDKDGA